MHRIERIARNVRRWAENAYRAHRRYYTRDLGGLCSITAVEIFKRCRRAGFSPVLCCNAIHSFVAVDGKIVDVTATQFGREPVLVVPIRRGLSEAYRAQALFDSVRDFRRYLRSNEWPRHQINLPERRV